MILRLSTLMLFFVISCASWQKGNYIESGNASWYGKQFHGRQTANGDKYNMFSMTAAHKTLPFNSQVKVVRRDNGNYVIVRINDRGPFIRGRVIDLSYEAAKALGIVDIGEAAVELYLINN
ncbi:MAG: hypothetical protein A4S09_04590 [Proteobacteria bacterium SG_bin7]|nr:MAG: hypothetical protein A4S09_04590 [Proteobacteria bacterium SG_bin7]